MKQTETTEVSQEVPTLYYAWLEANNFLLGGNYYNGVKIDLFKSKGKKIAYSKEEYEKMIKDYDQTSEESKYAEEVIQELFTKNEIEVLKVYFDTYIQGSVFKYRKAKLPLSKPFASILEIYQQNYKDGTILCFHENKGYPFNFKTRGILWYPYFKDPISISIEEVKRKIREILTKAEDDKNEKIVELIKEWEGSVSKV